jgi:hypothetical protein
MNKSDPSPTPRNFNHLPLVIKQTIGLSKKTLENDVCDEANRSSIQYDDVTFDFLEQAVEVRAPTWSLTVFICKSEEDGTTYTVHLTGGIA